MGQCLPNERVDSVNKTQHDEAQKPKDTELGGVSSELLLKSLFRLGMHKNKENFQPQLEMDLISIEVAISAVALF